MHRITTQVTKTGIIFLFPLITGALVYSGSVMEDGTHPVDLGQRPNGVYILKVYNKGLVIHQERVLRK